MQVAEARPPFVAFEVKAEEDRQASIDAGYYKTKDVIYALITPQGSKDRIEREVQSWFASMRQSVQEGRFPREWLRVFEENFKAWQEGREIPENGTPLLTWPVASPAQVKSVIDVGVRTVEDLAQANEETIMRIGMGGRALKEKALSWLQAAASTGKVTEELSALRAELADERVKNKTLETQLQELSKKVEALTKK